MLRRTKPRPSINNKTNMTTRSPSARDVRQNKHDSSAKTSSTKTKGTTQNYERYLLQAKEALNSGDRVAAERYYQQADHCLRVMNEKRENPHVKQPESQIVPIVTDPVLPTLVDSAQEESPANKNYRNRPSSKKQIQQKIT